MKIKYIIASIYLLFSTLQVFSQIPDSILKTLKQQPVVKIDSPVKKLPAGAIKPYGKVINKSFKTSKGPFLVHVFKDTVYFEVPDSLLNRDIQVINRLEKSPGGIGSYAGELLGERTIRFEQNSGDSTIRIRYNLVISQADSTTQLYKAVSKSNENPIIASFPIAAYGKNRKSFVFEIGKYLRTPTSFFNEAQKLDATMDQKLIKDIALEYVNAYPINVEISIRKNATQKLGLAPISLVTHTSFVLLPLIPMQQRIYDPRVGYFADLVYNYGDSQQKVEFRKFALRWRLEPRAEDYEKWKSGKLVEPAKPIVIYIDPATPKQWRPFLIQGVNDFQKAFEQAGFKNAIMGKEWPENDTTMHVDDARYSFINYLPSATANAYGPQIHDPRSGEIIQTQIGWYHNVMKLVHDWYLIQTAAVDPKARFAKFDDALMGQLIRFVSSHEVGHTLGLRHNMGSSSLTPVDSLRSNKYLNIHGHTASIMDYARFNYVAQPEDHIEQKNLFPRIGDYDRWAIEWGYGISRGSTAEEDQKALSKYTTERVAKNPKLWFGPDNRESMKSDPRSLSEDLGDNAMKASSYGIKNLKRILPNLPSWTKHENDDYEALRDLYTGLKSQFTRYMQHVMANVAGVSITSRVSNDGKPVYELTPKSKQEEALAFFDAELFTTPYWLINPQVVALAQEPMYPDYVSNTQVQVLNSLLDIQTLNQLTANQRLLPDQAYPLEKYIEKIHQAIWKELNTPNVVMDSYRRGLQKSYLGATQAILLSPTPDRNESEAFSVLRADLIKLQQEVDKALPIAADSLTQYHLMDIQNRIKNTIEAKISSQ